MFVVTNLENWYNKNRIVFDNTLDPRFYGLDGAGNCPDNEKVRITQIYLCNANKMK